MPSSSLATLTANDQNIAGGSLENLSTPLSGDGTANGTLTPNGTVALNGTGYPGGTVTVAGTVADQATREKVLLCCGNVEGVDKVDDQLTVINPEPPATFHTVVRGDTLSAIAKHFYGNANAYMKIFEANRPMLGHPDKIYPGQMLRIPA